MKNMIFTGAWVVAAVVLSYSTFLGAAEMRISDEPPQAVSIRNVSVNDGEVSGEIVNSSSRTIRDVQLQVRSTWLWKNEMKPGQDSRSDAVYEEVRGDIAPGASKPFKYRTGASMAGQGEGRYDVTVRVAGFTEMIPVK